MGPLTVTELNTFNGGMNNVTAPYLLRRDESTLLVNIDLRRGSMYSMARPIKHSDAKQAYFYQFKDTVYYFGSWRSNVLWDNKWYWSDGASTGKVLLDGKERPLGLPTPLMAPDCTSSGTGPHTGDFKYCYTFYDNLTGVESAPSPLSSYVSATDNTINVKINEMIPIEATHYRIYRIGGYLPYFMLVEMTTIDDYGDSLDDTQIDGRILNTIRNGPPPQGIHYFTELNGRLFGAAGNKLYYSAIGNPDSWYVYDFIPCQNTVKGLAKVPGGLIVFGDSWCNILKGNDPMNFVLRELSNDIGMVDAQSLNYIDQSAIWLSNNGVCASDGYSIQQLTVDRIENIHGIRPAGSAVKNNTYYLAFKPELYPAPNLYPSPDLYPNGVRGTGGIDQGILTMDFKRGQGYAYKVLDIVDVTYIAELDGEVAAIKGVPGQALFAECESPAYDDCSEFSSCTGWELAYIDKVNIGMLFDYDNLAELDYISPLMIDGTTTTLKEYDKVRVLFKGRFALQVLFDNDRLISEIYLDSSTIENYTFMEMKIPNEDNRAYSIRFKVTGKGIIKGIQYTYKMRELP